MDMSCNINFHKMSYGRRQPLGFEPRVLRDSIYQHISAPSLQYGFVFPLPVMCQSGRDIFISAAKALAASACACLGLCER